MSLAYLLGAVSGKALHVKPNIPLLLVLSLLPDIDIIYDLLTGSAIHRGATHSVLFALLIFIPVFIVYRKRAVPYFLALISHSLIGDFFIGGQIQLLWPFSTAEFGLHELGFIYIGIYNPLNIALEMVLFTLAVAVLFWSGDWKVFFKADKLNLVLIIPVATVLLPSIVGYPFAFPLIFTQPVLALAHLFYLVLFSVAIIKTLIAIPINRDLLRQQLPN